MAHRFLLLGQEKMTKDEGCLAVPVLWTSHIMASKADGL